jgi:hypothetical protein
MDRKMLWALAAAAAIAAPASAAPSACRGNACREVTPIFTQGCWSYRNNSTYKLLRGVVSAGAEPVPFEIPPNTRASPRLKSGACLTDEWPYQVDSVGKWAPRRGGQ